MGIIETEKTLFENGTVAYPPVGQASDEVDVYTHLSGITRYEITNYLGNVNAVITDRKTWDAAEGNFVATVKMTCDYYPFGMEMPGRHTSSSDYRYGYNGMEKDDEVKGEGNSYTTEFRQYDARLGRWLSLEPLMQEFPWMSPYVAFDNNPIYYIDPYGLSATNDGGKKIKKVKNDGDKKTKKVKKDKRQKTEKHTQNDTNSTQGTDQKSEPTIKELEEVKIIAKRSTKQSTRKYSIAFTLNGIEFRLTGTVPASASKGYGWTRWVRTGIRWLDAILIADDATGVGVVDDVLIPIAEAVYWFTYIIDWTQENAPVTRKQDAKKTKEKVDEKTKVSTVKKTRSPDPIGKRIRFNTRKGAYDAAKKAGGGNEPVKHNDGEHGPHYHPADGNGKQLNHDHYYYPKGK